MTCGGCSAVPTARPLRRCRRRGAAPRGSRALPPRDAGAPPPPLYTALLSSAGRVLFDAFLHPAPPGAGAEGALLADVSSDAAPQVRNTPPRRGDGGFTHTPPRTAQLAAHLARFRLRSRVGIADASGDWAVWAHTPPAGDAPAAEPDAAAAAAGWRRDPRLRVRPFRS